MSNILIVYSEEPNFPATDNNPDAVRYEINGQFIDATGGRPSNAEITAFFNAAKVQN